MHITAGQVSSDYVREEGKGARAKEQEGRRESQGLFSPGILTHDSNPSTWEDEAGFEDCVSYLASHCLFHKKEGAER